MKILSTLLVGLFSILLVIGCSSSPEDQPQQIVSPDGSLSGTPMTQEEVKQMILDEIDDLGFYDVIVTDEDGWDIRLFESRDRTNRDAVTYRGSLAYYSGQNYYEGTATGIWDYENNIFSCTCLDSSWNGGHINYVMDFHGYTSNNEVTLQGPYYYLENTNRLDRVYAWVYEGNGAFPYINHGVGESESIEPQRRTAEEIAEFLSQPTDRHKDPLE
jgi:hypothetical protein